MLCDQVAVTTDDLRRLYVAWRRHPILICAALYGGAPGLPAIFPRWAFPDLLELRGDRDPRLVLRPTLWLVFCAAVLWSVVYDTFYAMVDREDDVAIGVKSTAILFGDADRLITALLQAVVMLLLWLAGRQLGMGLPYTVALFAGALLFAWQQRLIRERDRARCFEAFLNNNLFGLAIFAGIASDYLLR